MALMSDEIGRAAAHRASADAALDALRFQLQQGTQSLLADQQSRVGAAGVSVRVCVHLCVFVCAFMSICAPRGMQRIRGACRRITF